ncbi:MAG: hypothetical protein M1819_002140 [Sarea resinae]|nr:MAG: hypothetical protein M1819_002140 [Sarea resinae]
MDDHDSFSSVNSSTELAMPTPSQSEDEYSPIDFYEPRILELSDADEANPTNSSTFPSTAELLQRSLDQLPEEQPSGHTLEEGSIIEVFPNQSWRVSSPPPQTITESYGEASELDQSENNVQDHQIWARYPDQNPSPSSTDNPIEDNAFYRTLRPETDVVEPITSLVRSAPVRPFRPPTIDTSFSSIFRVVFNLKEDFRNEDLYVVVDESTPSYQLLIWTFAGMDGDHSHFIPLGDESFGKPIREIVAAQADVQRAVRARDLQIERGEIEGVMSTWWLPIKEASRRKKASAEAEARAATARKELGAAPEREHAAPQLSEPGRSDKKAKNKAKKNAAKGKGKAKQVESGEDGQASPNEGSSPVEEFKFNFASDEAAKSTTGKESSHERASSVEAPLSGFVTEMQDHVILLNPHLVEKNDAQVSEPVTETSTQGNKVSEVLSTVSTEEAPPMSKSQKKKAKKSKKAAKNGETLLELEAKKVSDAQTEDHKTAPEVAGEKDFAKTSVKSAPGVTGDNVTVNASAVASKRQKAGKRDRKKKRVVFDVSGGESSASGSKLSESTPRDAPNDLNLSVQPLTSTPISRTAVNKLYSSMTKRMEDDTVQEGWQKVEPSPKFSKKAYKKSDAKGKQVENNEVQEKQIQGKSADGKQIDENVSQPTGTGKPKPKRSGPKPPNKQTPKQPKDKSDGKLATQVPKFSLKTEEFPALPGSPIAKTANIKIEHDVEASSGIQKPAVTTTEDSPITQEKETSKTVATDDSKLQASQKVPSSSTLQKVSSKEVQAPAEKILNVEKLSSSKETKSDSVERKDIAKTTPSTKTVASGTKPIQTGDKPSSSKTVQPKEASQEKPKEASKHIDSNAKAIEVIEKAAPPEAGHPKESSHNDKAASKQHIGENIDTPKNESAGAASITTIPQKPTTAVQRSSRTTGVLVSGVRQCRDASTQTDPLPKKHVHERAPTVAQVHKYTHPSPAPISTVQDSNSHEGQAAELTLEEQVPSDPRNDPNRQAIERPDPPMHRFEQLNHVCTLPSCGKALLDMDPGTLICLNCGPYSDTRYCSTEHRFADATRHWDECSLAPYQFVFDAGSTPEHFFAYCPMLLNKHSHSNTHLFRQQLYSMHRPGCDYAIFEDFVKDQYLDEDEAAEPQTPTTKLTVVVLWEPDDPVKDMFNRLLNVAIFDHTLVRVVHFLWRFLRQTLRARGLWTTRVSYELNFQFSYEFMVTPMMADFSEADVDVAQEWEADGSPAGLRALCERMEAQEWMLRIWRRNHPTERKWHRRMWGYGFPGVEESALQGFPMGEGWDGWTFTDCDIPGHVWYTGGHASSSHQEMVQGSEIEVGDEEGDLPDEQDGGQADAASDE